MSERTDDVSLGRRRFGIGALALAAAAAGPAPAHAATPSGQLDPKLSPADVWKELVLGNRRFMQDKPRSRSLTSRRRELEARQTPSVVILGCADSRVSPTLVFDQNLGDLFVVSIAGNVGDDLAVASIEYAVSHFPVKVLVVLGHERCGAVVEAAAKGTPPTPSLAELVRKIEQALAPLRDRASGEELVKLGVEANVHHSAADILGQSPPIRGVIDSGRVLLVKALYRLGTGEVVRLR